MTAVRGIGVGVTDVGTGQPFFWGHGFASSRAQDQRTQLLDWKRLAGGCRLVRWDARGHGDSDGVAEPGEYRWDNLGRDLVALADALDVERFAAGGVSMGAAIALHAAAQAPDRVYALALVLPPTAYETRAIQAREYLECAAMVEREGVDAYAARVNSAPMPGLLEEFASRYQFVPAVSEQLLPAVLRGAAESDLPAMDAIRSIEAPTLVLAWDADPGHPLSTAERLVHRLPRAELHVARDISDLGSWTERIETFLARL